MSYGGQTFVIPLGQKGLLTDVSPGLVPFDALIDANNVTLNLGSVEKMAGSHKYNNNALTDEIIAIFDWNPSPNVQRLIAATKDGSLWRDIGDHEFMLNTAINTGLGPLTNATQFVEGGNEVAGQNKKLFYFPASSQVQVLNGDGTSFSDISSPSVDWATPNFPTGGVIHRNRLWVFGNPNVQAGIYASDTADHENFQSNFLFNNIFPGEGGQIQAAIVYKGRMFVFKEGNFVYFLQDSDSSSANWYFSKLSSSFGLAAPHSVSQVVDDLILGNVTGSITSMKAVDAFGDIESGDMLARLVMENYMRDHTSLSGVALMHSLYYEAKKQAYFTYSSKYGVSNDKMLVLDMNSEQPRVTFADKDNPSCLGLRKDIVSVPRPMYGSTDGFVYLMDQEDRDVGGSGYEGMFQTPHIDFRAADPGMATKNKIFDFLDIDFVPQGQWNVTIEVFLDGDFSETLTVLMKPRNDGLGEFVLDQSKLGRQDSQRIRKRLHGMGRTISFRVKNSGNLENFRISTLSVSFRLSGEQGTRV